MNKSVFLTILIIFFHYLQSSAQELKFGYNSSNFSGLAANLQGELSLPFNSVDGISLGCSSPSWNFWWEFSTQLELFYSAKGASFEETNERSIGNILRRTQRNGQYSMRYLELTLPLRLSMFNKRLELFVAPYIEAFLSGELEQKTVVEFSGVIDSVRTKVCIECGVMNDPGYGFAFGLTYNLGPTLFEFRYSTALSDIFEGKELGYRHRVAQFMVGVSLERIFFKNKSRQSTPRITNQSFRQYGKSVNRPVFTVRFDDGKMVKPPTKTIKRTRQFHRKTTFLSTESGEKIDKLHPKVKTWLKKQPGDKIVQFVVTLIDTLTLPIFPEPVPNEPLTTPANKEKIAKAHALVQEIRNRRDREYAKLKQEIKKFDDTSIIKTYWLINGFVAESPLSVVLEIAKRPDVLYIAPVISGEKPPVAPPNNKVIHGRQKIGSDAFLNSGLEGGWIALLDTGIKESHYLLSALTGIIDPKMDLALSGNTNDGYINGHGTSTAAIIAGHDSSGEYQGVTKPTVMGNFKVYIGAGLNTDAAVTGFQWANLFLQKVIVAEIQADGTDYDQISTAADHSFDIGAVVIAANGNAGSTEPVKSPANAHKVIGVGAFNVETEATDGAQSHGPTADGRFKPDIQAPTDTETAGTTSLLHTYGGTSGATPYAAGAALLFRNMILKSVNGLEWDPVDPGYVYALLILSGQTTVDLSELPDPNCEINKKGAGPILLPSNGVVDWSYVDLNSTDNTEEIPLDIDSDFAGIDAAIWWPESDSFSGGTRTNQHNNLDLHIVGPSGNLVASSELVNSVFERAVFINDTGAPSDDWKLRIQGTTLNFSPQKVYWAVYIRNSSAFTSK